MVAGFILAALALGGVYFGVRATIGQWLYQAAKYGRGVDRPEAVMALSQRSLQWYPANGRLCEFAAEWAYSRSFEPGATNAPELRLAARFWCDRGLALNFYSPYLRWLRSQLLWDEDRAAAIANWADYTEWHFWDAYNHAQLCEMYARDGRIEAAERELIWVRGSPYEAGARKAVDAAKAARVELRTEDGDSPSASNGSP